MTKALGVQPIRLEISKNQLKILLLIIIIIFYMKVKIDDTGYQVLVHCPSWG